MPNSSFSTSTTPVWIEYDNQGWIEPKPLVIHLMESEEYRNDYFNALCEIINSGYIVDQYENDIGIYQKLISLDLQADTNKFYSFEDFEMALFEDTFIEVEFEGFPFDELHKGLTPYLSDRSEEVIDEIEMHGYSCNASSVNESEKFQINLWPNPSDGRLNVQFSSVPDQLAVFNNLGQSVICYELQMSENVNLDLSYLSAGVYLVQASFGSESECFRFVME
ncbi:MAG: T9SS type A sorting domain-containing protein [Flavobacteriales bacterium]